TSVYNISTSAQSYSDFQGSAEASDFLLQNTECEVMPLPVIMHIANLIKLHPVEYDAFVGCIRDGDELNLSNYSGDRESIYAHLNKDASDYLEAFNKYVETAKQQKGKLATITDSDEMEALLGDMCSSMYAQFTGEERIQIIKVLTQRSNWINGCLISNRMKCEE